MENIVIVLYIYRVTHCSNLSINQKYKMSWLYVNITYIPRSISVIEWLNAEEGLQVVLQVVISRLPKKRLFWDMKSVFVHKYMYIKSLNAMGDSKLCVSKSLPKCYSWLACHWSYNGFILIHQFYITPSIYI